MLDRRRVGRGAITLGADKAYDVQQFVERSARAERSRRTSRSTRTSEDRQAARHGHRSAARPVTPAMRSASAAASASRRCSAGSRVPLGLAKVKLRGRAKVDAAFTLALAAYNLVRLPKLLASADVSLKGKWRIVEMPDCRGRLSRSGRAGLYPVRG